MAFVARLGTFLARVPLRVRVVVLGLLSWLLCAALPALHRPAGLSALDVLLVLLAPLVLGVAARLEATQKAFAPHALLTAFPVALALATSRIDHDAALSTFAPSTLLVAVLSLAAFGVSALALTGQARALRAVERKPLGEVAPIEPETRRQRLGALVLNSVTLGMLGILVWGTWASPAHYREHWGASASAGSALTALGAGITGCIAIAIVAPGLRAERAEPVAPEVLRRKLTWLALVATSGLVVYALTRLRS
jgi:hypothetical protein